MRQYVIAAAIVLAAVPVLLAAGWIIGRGVAYVEYATTIETTPEFNPKTGEWDVVPYKRPAK